MLEGRELHGEIDIFNTKGTTHVYITNVWNKKMTGMDYISYLYARYISVSIDKYIYIHIKKRNVDL